MPCTASVRSSSFAPLQRSQREARSTAFRCNASVLRWYPHSWHRIVSTAGASTESNSGLPCR